MAPTTNQVTIREYAPGDEAAFRQLNEEWITRYFRIEEKDREALYQPHVHILGLGGRIFFAVVDERCVGCCALVPMGEGDYEVAKMAVTSSCQGLGIGRKVLQAVVDAARLSGARRLHLETNHVLTRAIHLYESIGFHHVQPAQPSPYARADVFMEMDLA
jgi:GNAT superfamily N-acetyltransferase